MVKLAALPEILGAAQILERRGLLLHGEKANEVVKRYIVANPDINDLLAKSANTKITSRLRTWLKRTGRDSGRVD